MRDLRQLIQNGGCALNGWLSLPCAFSAELMAQQQWDSLTIDLQHGLADHATMTAILTAVAAKPVLVRVPWLTESDIMRALDAGAAGILCPMINTRADADRLAASVRYPPVGHRSYGPIRALIRHGDDYYRRANDEIIALAMIETREGLAAVDDIVATPGLDGVYIGPADLSCALGHPPTFQPTAAEVLSAIDHILAAAKKHGRIAGIHANDPATAKKWRDKGFNFITAATDARLIATAGAAILSAIKKGDTHEDRAHDDSARASGISGGATY